MALASDVVKGIVVFFNAMDTVMFFSVLPVPVSDRLASAISGFCACGDRSMTRDSTSGISVNAKVPGHRMGVPRVEKGYDVPPFTTYP